MQNLEVSGAVRHIYIYIYVIRRLKVNMCPEGLRRFSLTEYDRSRLVSGLEAVMAYLTL